MNIGTVEGTIKLRDEFTAVLARAEKQSDQGMGRIARNARDAGAAIADLERKMAKLAKVPAMRADAVGSAKSLAAIRAENRALEENIAAVRKGPAAVQALANEREVMNRLLAVGVTRESAYGREIERQIRNQQRYRQELDQASDELERQGRSAEIAAARMQKLGAGLSSVGSTLTRAVTLPLAAVGIGSLKLASDFESSFAGIIKTVNDATDEFGNLTAIGADLRQGMRDLSKEIPVNVNELNRIGEAAGQLGIESENILGFTRTVAAMGVTTNLASDQAATSLARLANITGLPQTEFDRLGSTIVDLGNSFATTEAEIVELGLRIAGAGDIAGLAEAEILAIGAALSSVGVEAEAGGTAVQKVLLGMVEAVASGGRDLEVFAQTAGQSADEFAQSFRDDAGAAFAAFVAGLGQQGDAAFRTLEALNLADQRLIRSFLSLANAGDLLERTMRTGNEAFADNTALATEAEQRYKTFASQLTIFWNQLKDIGITLGTSVLPLLQDLLKVARPLIDAGAGMAGAFAKAPEPIRAVAVALLAMAAAAGPALFVTGQLIIAWGTLADMAPGVAARIALVGNSLRTLATGPLGLLAAAFIATGAVINAQIKKWGNEAARDIATMTREINGLKAALDGLREAARRGVITDEEILATNRALAEINKRLAEIRKTLKFSSSPSEREGLIFERDDLEQRKAALEAWIKVARTLPRINEEITVTAEETEDEITNLGDALKDALKSIADTTAEQEALLSALADSQEAYDILNVLLGAGVPLSDALTGAYDEQAKELLNLNKVLDELLARREKAADAAREAIKLEEELAKAIQDAIDASASGDVRSGPQFPIFAPPEGITNEYFEISEAAAAIRREEEKRALLLAEIRRQLEAGLITQEEARAITEQMNIETNAMAQALETMMKRAWENIQDAAAGAISDIFKDLIKTGNSAIDRLLGSFIDMLAELLVVWAANAAKRALLERGVGAAGGVSGGGGGGGFGWLGALKSLFGFGGGGAVASSSTATATGITGVVGTGTSASGASIAGLSSTAVAVMGTAAVAAAVYVLADRYVKNQKSGKTAGTVQFGGGEGIQAFSGQKALNDAMVQAAKELQEAFRQFEVLTGATIGTLEKVTINVKNSGKIWVTIGDLLTASFDNMEEAVGFAIRESLRNAEHIGLSPAAQAALAHSAAKTLDQLNDDLAFAIAAEEKVMGTEGRAAARQWVDGYIKDFEREISLGLVEALGGQSAALMNMVDDLVGAFNAFKGIEQDPAERVRAEAEALKARAEIAQAMLLATRAEIIAKQAELEASGAMAAGHGATAIAISESAAAAVLAGSALSDAMVNQAQVAATSAEAIALANAAALAAIDKALEAIAALELTQADIDKAVARARAAASKGGASPMEQLRKTLEQMEFDRLLQGMTELEAGLATLDRQYEEQKKLAQGNAELLALLNAEYEKQEELLRKQVQLNAVDTFRNFMGIGADPFSQLGKGFEDAKSAVEEAGFGAERTARMVDRLTNSYQHQLDQLSQQEFVAIGDGLMGILETYYGGVEGFEEFRVKLEQFRFDLELANLRLRFEILKAEGSLAEAVLARAQEVFDFIDANPIDWDNFIAPSAPRFQQASRGINNALEEMVRRLETAKEGIRDFLLSLQRGAFGGRSNEEMFNAAFRQFQELASQPGNIQAQENFPEVARNLLEIARERFGSTAEFQRILDMVEAAGLDFLDVTRVTEDNVVFDQRFLDAQRVQLDVDRKGYQSVVQATQNGFLMMSAAENQSRDEIVAEIRGLRESQNLLNKRLQAIESRRRTEKVA